MVKIGSGQGAESQGASRESSPWYKQNLSLVDPNSDSWFESFGPMPASELYRAPLAAMGEAAGLLSYVAAGDLKIVQGFEVSPEDLGSPLEIPSTNLGQEFLKTLEQEKVEVSYKSAWAVNHVVFEETASKKRIQGQWETEGGTPFLQYLEIHNDQDGDEVAYWFVDLLLTPVHIESINQFELEADEKDGSISSYTLETESGGFSIGQLSTRLALPVFLKQLAFMSETPFPSTQIMTMSRDLAFSGVPEEARPAPFFTIKNYSEANGFSNLQTTRNNGESNSYEGSIFPQVVQFGWNLSTRSIPYLGQLLPVIINGCSSAMTTTEDGYVNFRSPDFSAPWDDALGNPCSKLMTGGSRQSRARAPQWIPVTQIGDLLVNTRDLFESAREDSEAGDSKAAREKLAKVVEDGAGPLLVSGINSYIYSHLIPELAKNPDLISEIEYLANQAADQLMQNESTNAMANLGVAYFKLKEFESSSSAFLAALDKPDRFAEAEASYFMALIETERGNLELAKKYEERCRAARGHVPAAGLLEPYETRSEKAVSIEPFPNHFLDSSTDVDGLVAEPSEVSSNLNLHGIFPAIPENSIIRQLVSNFGSKLKLSQALSTSSFEGGEHSSDSYYVLLKLSLLYSAVEGWERLTGKGLFSVIDKDLADSLASDSAWKHFREKLLSVTSSAKLRTSLQAFYDRETSDLIPILTTIRNAFFHPGLTATNSTLVSKPKLRQLLLQTCARVESALLESFEDWSLKMQSWHDLESVGDDELMESAKTIGVAAGYPREAIQIEFRKELTDGEWAILIEELWCEDEFSVEETIADVVSNIADYASEHGWWNDKINSLKEDSNES